MNKNNMRAPSDPEKYFCTDETKDSDYHIAFELLLFTS